MKSNLWNKMGIKYPIIQGAMAHVADPDLVSAVAEAGGLGILATGGDTADQVQAKVEETQSKTDKAFGVNVYLMSPNVEEVVDYLCQSGVRIVTTGAGSPGKYMSKFKDAGMTVIPVVASVAVAQRMERAGADAIVAEGTEAGGHIGKTTTMTLVPQVVDAVDIPVIAAGGIADGRGMAAALCLGASGIQVGTRFSVAKESNAHPNWKKRVFKAKDIDSDVTGAMTGHPVRQLRNKMTRLYHKKEKEIAKQDNPDFNELTEISMGSLSRAVHQGDEENGSFMVGQSAALVDKEESCEEIIQSYLKECQEVLEQVSQDWSANNF